MDFFRAIGISFFLTVVLATSAMAAGPGSTVNPWLASAVRIGAMVLTFAGIIFFLRYLYGPQGKFRPKEFGTEHIDERRQRKAALAGLRRDVAEGRISKDEYAAERERIERA
ncbi:hypothetical protein [Desulfobaculum sp.]|jgi:uncharacterized membrane protein